MDLGRQCQNSGDGMSKERGANGSACGAAGFGDGLVALKPFAPALLLFSAPLAAGCLEINFLGEVFPLSLGSVHGRDAGSIDAGWQGFQMPFQEASSSGPKRP